jgi:hypothetical protein
MSEGDPLWYWGGRVCQQEWAYWNKSRGIVTGIRAWSLRLVITVDLAVPLAGCISAQR